MFFLPCDLNMLKGTSTRANISCTRKQASPSPEPAPPHGRLRRSRVETHIVVGNINDKVLAPDKTWFQKGEGAKVQDAFYRGLEALFYDDRQLARCIKMGGNANIGIEYGPRSGRLHAHILLTLVHYSRVQFDGKRASDFLIKFMQTEGQGGLPNFYKDDWFGEEYQKTAVRPIRRKDALGMQWTGKETGYRKRETARQMHVDVKLLPQSNLKDLLQLYITKTVEALETGAVKLV
eukprot:tig00021761_g23439.t1